MVRMIRVDGVLTGAKLLTRWQELAGGLADDAV
jgi:hypothetical protein